MRCLETGSRIHPRLLLNLLCNTGLALNLWPSYFHMLSAGHRCVTIPSGVIFFPLKYHFQKCMLTFSINFRMRFYNAFGRTQDSESMKDLTIHSNGEGLPSEKLCCASEEWWPLPPQPNTSMCFLSLTGILYRTRHDEDDDTMDVTWSWLLLALWPWTNHSTSRPQFLTL